MNHGVPSVDDPEKHRAFTREVKLEPFSRGLRDLEPRVWFAGIRKAQTPYRDTLDHVSPYRDGILRVSPVFYFSDQDMDGYLAAHDLPDERDYYDPTKVLDKRECGLHTELHRGAGI